MRGPADTGGAPHPKPPSSTSLKQPDSAGLLGCCWGATPKAQPRPGSAPTPQTAQTGHSMVVGNLPQDPTFLRAPHTVSGCPQPTQGLGRRAPCAWSRCWLPPMVLGRVVPKRGLSPAGRSAGSNKHMPPDRYFECTWGPAVKRNPLVSTFIN